MLKVKDDEKRLIAHMMSVRCRRKPYNSLISVVCGV